MGKDLARYRVAAEAGDVDAILELVAPDAELVSPISGRLVFRGRADLRVLFVALYGTVKGIRWTYELGDDVVRVLIGDARVGPLRLTDAMVVELAPDGRIQRFRPHLRPWLALTLLALILGPKVARHPEVVRRALAADATAQPQHT
jgi:hypothetical protein